MIFKHREPEIQGLESPAYKLSAIVGADSFFYAIEFASHQLVHLETHFQDSPLALFQDPFDFLADLMAKNPLLFESFDQKCIGLLGVPYMVVPLVQFRQRAAARMLGGMTHLAAKDSVHVQELPGLGAVCIFAIPIAFKHEVEMYFDAPVYQHVMGGLLNWFGSYSSEFQAGENRIHVHGIGQYACIIGVQDGKVVFHNQFRCVEVPDLIYFISAVLEDLGWIAGNFKVSVSGHRRSEILADSDFIKLFSAFLSRLPLQTSWPEETHEYLDLIAISRCAS